MLGRPPLGCPAGGRAPGIGLRRTIRWLLCAALTVHALHLSFIAWRLPVDYWDGYEYLSNAEVLAGKDVAHAPCDYGYSYNRPPLVPLLLSPVLWGYAPGGRGTSIRGPHLLAVTLSILSVAALYWLLRQAFSPVEALVGGAVLAANPLFIHYAPFVMTDIPTMLFVTVAAVAYLHARQRGGWLLHALAAVSLAAATLAKYTASALLGGLAVFELLRVLFPVQAHESPVPGLGRRVWRLLKDFRPWLMVGAAVIIFYLVQAWADARAVPWLKPLTHIVTLFRQSVGGGPFWDTDPRAEFVYELAAAFSAPLLLAAVGGMVVGVLRRTEMDLLCLAWFGVMFGMLTFLVAHKEARYVSPVLPPLVYFIVRGLREFSQFLTRRLHHLVGERSLSRRVPELVAALVLLCFAAKPVALAGGELRRFYDPVYAKAFLPEVARWALSHAAPGQRVLTSGRFFYTLYPKDPVFSPYDEFFYFHQAYRCTLAYLLDRPLEEIDPVPLAAGLNWATFVDRFATSEVVLSGGPLIDTRYGSWPEPPEPMTLTFVGRRTLARVEGATPDGATYQAVDDPSARLVLARTGSGWEVSEGRPGADWQVYQRRAPGAVIERFGTGPASEPPAVIELVRVEQLQKTFR